MILIRVGDIYSTLHEVTPDVLRVVRSVCRARPSGYQYMKKFKRGHWDGYISLMNGLNSFPTGLLTLVERALKQNDYEYELEVESPILPFTPASELSSNILKGITLRGYQIRAVVALLRTGRGIAKMATNSGKTEVMAAMIKVGWDLLGDDFQAIIILHRKELLYQTAERIKERTGLEVGMIGDGSWEVGQITVAMVQTLANKKQFDEFDGNIFVFIDECHHASSSQMLDILFNIPGSYRFGFSGTPLKYDELSDMKLIAATGEVVCDVSNKYLIEEEYSAEPIVKLHVIESEAEALWEANYQDAYSNGIVQNDIRNAVITDIANESKGIVLILVNIIEHGNMLRDAIPDSIFIHGSDTMDDRNAVLEMMRDGKKGVYIASPIFEEGVDVPAIDTIILAAGGKSVIKLLQRIGRGLRKKENGNELIVHDFIDDTNKYLLNHSDDRIKVYEQEGFKHSIV